MSILVLDNYDSFTYNLVHMLRTLGATGIAVHRNNKIPLEDVKWFKKILLSPGPGIPLEAGIMPALVERYAPTHPILGVCLGHQCIGEVFGGVLHNLGRPVHGKRTEITITQKADPLFAGLPETIAVGRYHSWVVEKKSIPECLEVTAVDSAGEVMALRHRTYNVHGVQFHPESVLTDFGAEMLERWLKT